MELKSPRCRLEMSVGGLPVDHSLLVRRRRRSSPTAIALHLTRRLVLAQPFEGWMPDTAVPVQDVNSTSTTSLGSTQRKPTKCGNSKAAATMLVGFGFVRKFIIAWDKANSGLPAASTRRPKLPRSAAAFGPASRDWRPRRETKARGGSISARAGAEELALTEEQRRALKHRGKLGG